ncbi:MAG: nitroreductase [Ruminococcaceae bacterium]|nr:nitroreductase [Oscillospiraceae bacterium]
MENIQELVKSRRSVRTYDGREITAEDKAKLCAFMENTPNPYGINIEFKLMDAREHGLKCPVVIGTDLYVGGKIKRVPSAFEAFGYSFEMLVLYAQSLGIGTVWLGGTMNRSAYEAAMELSEDEMMPCASPLGYPAKKMSLRESMMRKAIKADERLPFDELFFDGSFDIPLTEEKAGELSYPLEMVRWAPSAVNKQPWRAVVGGNVVHFYLKRSSGFGNHEALDMQRIDMGIALCHFDLAAQELGMKLSFAEEDPGLSHDDGTVYIASYRID